MSFAYLFFFKRISVSVKRHLDNWIGLFWKLISRPLCCYTMYWSAEDIWGYGISLTLLDVINHLETGSLMILAYLNYQRF